MKNLILYWFLLSSALSLNAQSIQINQITPSAANGLLNINLVVTTYNGAGYLSHSYTVVGNTINLEVCYWFNITLPIYQINNNFLINVPSNSNYTINLRTINSSSQTICNNFSAGPTATISYLKTEIFDQKKFDYTIFPNPSNGSIEIKNESGDLSKIDIYDSTGRLQKTITDFYSKSIDLTDLNSGIYFVKLENSKGFQTQKLILNRKLAF